MDYFDGLVNKVAIQKRLAALDVLRNQMLHGKWWAFHNIIDVDLSAYNNRPYSAINISRKLICSWLHILYPPIDLTKDSSINR